MRTEAVAGGAAGPSRRAVCARPPTRTELIILHEEAGDATDDIPEADEAEEQLAPESKAAVEGQAGEAEESTQEGDEEDLGGCQAQIDDHNQESDASPLYHAAQHGQTAAAKARATESCAAQP